MRIFAPEIHSKEVSPTFLTGKIKTIFRRLHRVCLSLPGVLS